MKRTISLLLIAVMCLVMAGCGKQEAFVAKVENGTYVMSSEEVKERFNAQLDKGYANVQAFSKTRGEDDNMGCMAQLSDNISLFILANKADTNIRGASLTLDVNINNILDEGKENIHDESEKFGYYISKLIYTFDESITENEIYDLIEKLDLGNLFESKDTIHKDIGYSKTIDDKVHFSIIPVP